MSASANSAAASGTISAPCARYASSVMAEPRPAPLCTNTSCPASASSRTPAGVSATRYSSGLTSVGTPTFTVRTPPWSCDELAPAQRKPELDSVSRTGQVASGELLDPPDPVSQGVAVAIQPPRRPLPLPVLLDEGLERTHQLAPVLPLAG